jgi:hypothetical protein
MGWRASFRNDIHLHNGSSSPGREEDVPFRDLWKQNLLFAATDAIQRRKEKKENESIDVKESTKALSFVFSWQHKGKKKEKIGVNLTMQKSQKRPMCLSGPARHSGWRLLHRVSAVGQSGNFFWAHLSL